MSKIETNTQAKVPELFYVWSTGIVNGYYNVPIEWFACRSHNGITPDLPWSALIEGYDPKADKDYPKNAVAEMFTEFEAKALVDYLERTDPEGAPIMGAVKLPVPGWLISMQDWSAMSDGRIIFSLSDNEGYSLPFSVGGYCRLAGRRLIREEKSGEFAVYKDETRITTLFSDRGAAEAWASKLLGGV